MLTRKNFSHWAIQKCLKQVSISSLLSGKNMITFCAIWAILAGKRVRSLVKGFESKFDIPYFIHTILGQLSVKKFVSALSSFAAIFNADFLDITPTFLKNISRSA